MPEKRGRPPKEDGDERKRQKREAGARRARKHYNEHRRAQSPTQENLQPYERMVDFTIMGQGPAELEAAQTLAAMNLRVQALTLAQDFPDAQLREGATPVDEHATLYDDNELIAARNDLRRPSPTLRYATMDRASPRPVSSPSGRSRVPRFSSTRSPLNRLSTPITRTIQPSPIRPSFSPISPTLVENKWTQRRGSEDLRFADNDLEDDADDGDATEQYSLGDYREDAEVRGDETPKDDDNHGAESSDDNEINFIGRDEESEPPISDLQYAAEKLFAFFQGDVGGCTEEQHDERRRQRMASVADDDHHGLDDIFNDPDTPSVLTSPDLLTPDRLARHVPPTPAQLQSMFCGISPQQPRPPYVCLHLEETRAQPPRQGFDVDSFLGFLHSLAACREGLWHQPAPQARQNITTDVHLETPMFVQGEDPEQAPRATLAMLRDVPHILFGRVANDHDITIHILFPHLPRPQEKFVSLTQEQLSRWLDQIFYPILYPYCEAGYTQHLPASFRNAYADSKARQVEARLVETASYQAQQSLGYHLQPEYLGSIWTDILHRIETTPGLADFREPQLFFSSKGRKLKFMTSRSRPTQLDSMERFERHFENVFDLEFVDLERTYIDVGTEICPSVSHVPTHRTHVDEEAQVYAWKRCCLEQIIRRLYDDKPPAKNGKGQRFYDQNMLYEASSVTSVPPKGSRLYHGDVRYIQLYGSVKEVWDRAKRPPFSNDGLEEMALDDQIRQAARHLAGGRRREAKTIERSYCTAKCRTCDDLRDARLKSFSIRAEFRISWALFQALMARLRLEPRDQLEVTHADCPSYAWAIKTEVYLNFLWRNADKFATLFEMTRARCRRDLVTWEQTLYISLRLRLDLPLGISLFLAYLNLLILN
ncbi:uncharacterized protein PV07_12538 [Cladophialophora immunda]|uniref:Uncharacterized protein n=1 Tax=Cladophialophora immunda TaxID=569365 RepID=A0A0D1Z375_9EURO|nr:uncharacterized protein PV07_12538 [Cladophialophora immunda]KIW22076.1 hypothetical protein PV07_12538 [Cladophialophora immunda]